MSSKFDLCLLLYVIRLDGWLKHCNFSLSLHTGRSGALHGYTSELLRYAKLVATSDDPAPAQPLWRGQQSADCFTIHL